MTEELWLASGQSNMELVVQAATEPAGPALEKIGTRAVGKSANASPAIAGGRLFVRTDKALVCMDPGTP